MLNKNNNMQNFREGKTLVVGLTMEQCLATKTIEPIKKEVKEELKEELKEEVVKQDETPLVQLKEKKERKKKANI